MSEYDNTNRGSIWTSDKKTTDKHPDFTGNLNVEGKEYWINAWRGDGSNPKAPKLNFSVKAKDAAPAKSSTPAPAFDDDLALDVPF
jgi:hypothetical protein